MDEQWNLNSIPPKGSESVADFAYELFDIAKTEKDRLGKNKDFLSNYALYKGATKRQQSAGTKSAQRQTGGLTPVNLMFANVERTVAVITARNPTGEVVDLDGYDDGSEQVLSLQLKKWWKDTDQLPKIRHTARTMEVYGITVEKPFWDKSTDEPDIMVTDPFSFLPAPGNWDDMSIESPYICYAYVDFVSKVEAEFNVTGVAKDDAYELLGKSREELKPPAYGGQAQSIGNYADAMTVVNRGDSTTNKAVDRCLIIEVWLRDDRIKTDVTQQPILDESGQAVLDADGIPIYLEIKSTEKVCSDGIRKITITKAKDPNQSSKSGYMVLDDSANPNINPALPIEIASKTYPWGRLPVYHSNSYKDLMSVWGFSAAEQVGDLIIKINTIMTKLISYVINVMAPPLIVQQHCGITREMIESSITKSGRLILMPTTPNARIEFMQIPNLPSTFFQVLDLIVKFFDRIYQIEDADRGQAPSGVIAASAIVALQERNQITMQTKTSAIDNIAEQRARWAIGLWQNFGTKVESVNVGGTPTQFRGTDLAGRKFNYVVESGSSTPRTSLQKQETAKWLYQVKAIDRQSLLESMNWEDWKTVVERSAEGELGQALQIIIQAGMPQEEAMMLYQKLMLNQGGPGDVKKPPAPTGSQNVAPTQRGGM